MLMWVYLYFWRETALHLSLQRKTVFPKPGSPSFKLKIPADGLSFAQELKPGLFTRLPQCRLINSLSLFYTSSYGLPVATPLLSSLQDEERTISSTGIPIVDPHFD